MTKQQRHILFIVLSATAATLAVLLASAAFVVAAYQGKVLPRTVVAGVNIGGRDRSSANNVIEKQTAVLVATPLTLQLGPSSQSFLPKDLGVNVDTSVAEAALIAPTDPMGWLRPNFWLHFFARKQVPLTYQLTDQQLQQFISQKLDITDSPKDASLTVTNGAVTVVASQPGTTVDLAKFKTDLNHFFITGKGTTINLAVVNQTAPTISTDQAATVKTQIDQSLRPVNLVGGSTKFTISVADQYGLIAYNTTTDQKLTWQISDTKLTDYLQNVVAKKINVKPIQQVIENNTNRMITQGVDGQAMDIGTIEPQVFQALTSTDPKPAAITVPFKTVAFTETHINPSYTLNLFPSLYLDVSLSTQKITIINTDTVVAQYSISSGGWKTPTPIGTFYIFNKIAEAYSPDFKLWMPNWNGLATSPDGTGYLGYGIHSIVCWDKACTNREGESHIGHPVSHGCIRVEDAGITYIYTQVPIGTPVVIHD